MLCFGNHWDLQGAHRRLLPPCAEERRVFFVERPCGIHAQPHLRISAVHPNLWVVRPFLNSMATLIERRRQLCEQVASLAQRMQIVRPIVWYMHPDRSQAVSVSPASLVVCGPVADAALATEWRLMLAHADYILPEATPPEDVDHQCRDAFWDEEGRSMRLLLSLGAAEREPISA